MYQKYFFLLIAFTVSSTAQATPQQLLYVPLDKPCRIVDTRGFTSPFEKTNNTIQSFLAWGSAIQLNTQRDSKSSSAPACLPPSGLTPASMVANVTVVAKTYKSRGNLVAYPNGWEPPDSSLVNFVSNNIANSSIISLSPENNKHFDVQANIFGSESGGQEKADVVIDALGYFYPKAKFTEATLPSALTYAPLATPCRIVDTGGKGTPFTHETSQAFRAWGSKADLDLQRGTGVNRDYPACQTELGKTPAALMANVTVAAKAFKSRGNVVAYPAGRSVPDSSLVNFVSNNIANSSIISLNSDTDQHFNIHAKLFGNEASNQKKANVIVDAIGYFYPQTAFANVTNRPDLVYTPLDRPCRIVNTRGSLPFDKNRTAQAFLSWGSKSELDVQRDSGIPDDHAGCLPDSGLLPAAVAANVTVAAKATQSRGNVVVYPANSTAPSSSLVNFRNNNIANASIISLHRDGNQQFNVTAKLFGEEAGNQQKVDVIVDAIGYFYSANDNDEVLTRPQAARFLTQTTFGPTEAAIDQMMDLGSYEAWLEQQFATPISNQLDATKALWLKTCPHDQESGLLVTDPDTVADTNDATVARHNIWWQTALHSPDQLRQRVAFALSQILVVSEQPDSLNASQLGLASYYDTLLEHSFGNYRDLLQDVTLHPAMGLYLGMLKNEKADAARNTRPDENYARELMQLFSLGVNQLNVDGTLKLQEGQSIPTYNEQTVQAFARVFTGWDLVGINWGNWFGRGDRTQPMVAVQQYHDTGEKRLLNGFKLNAGQSAATDLNAALDNVFNHPNVGPFVSRQLIQRLVTSNPPPAYVERVVNVFNNNGLNVRGDLKAVVKAILLDHEAINGHKRSPYFGKLREPLLRLSHVFRAFKLQPLTWQGDLEEDSQCGRGIYPIYRIGEAWHYLPNLQGEIGQASLHAPSVFNFYQPNYSPPGAVRDQNLVAPEFQLSSENYVVSIANLLNTHIQETEPVLEVNNADKLSWLDLDRESELAGDADTLLDHLNSLLLNGAMSSELRNIIKAHLNRAVFTETDDVNLAKARDAISLIIMSAEYRVQK